MKSKLAILTLPLLIGVLPALAESNSFRQERLGFRFGIDGESEVDLESYEIYGVVATPWSWELKNDRKLIFEFEWSGGVLDGEDETAGLFKLAPQLRFQTPELPVDFVLSSGPSLITEDEIDDLDLGGAFQITSTVGVDWHVNESWTVGYRFQHISNAGIYSDNDGLNLNTISIDYRF